MGTLAKQSLLVRYILYIYIPFVLSLQQVPTLKQILLIIIRIEHERCMNCVFENVTEDQQDWTFYECFWKNICSYL